MMTDKGEMQSNRRSFTSFMMTALLMMTGNTKTRTKADPPRREG
jgi:hypothetical protein